MSTKHFCDGCDKEVPRHGDLKKVDVVQINPSPIIRGFSSTGVSVEPDARTILASIELCGECFQKFRDTLPGRWPREAEAAA